MLDKEQNLCNEPFFFEKFEQMASHINGQKGLFGPGVQEFFYFL